MIVLHKNEMYNLNMTYMWFEHLQRNEPRKEVELSPLSNNDAKIKAPAGEVFDYSRERNLNALKK